MHTVLAAALAGLAATAPMTVWMLGAQRLLPARERYPLPPERITEHAAEAVGLEAVAHRPPVRRAASLINHFAYGALAGALYAPLSRLPGPALLRGLGYGTVVWSASYLGLLPTLGLLSPATRHPPRRNALMIVAHFVWGSALALLTERWSSARR
ncbi:putative membrane protein [Deinobacterium chartae]|uniref:Putative membrane protein n=1 Tax=Deinobacterium chartae TaxID=521158 RepID=A0A841I691_9DEIO|nr:DUF6789 family protein [Deinobacterium chartae]MBB6099940.1 putative membrane protein [Deinobacterium chartae]